MTLLQPWWLLLGLLALPLVLWHARNPRVLTVPSLRIWKDVERDVKRANAPLRRFSWRFDRSLWMQLLALLALMAALAGPRPAGQVADHHLWLIDLSGSMESPHGEGTRLQAAVGRAVDSLEATDAASRGGPLLSVVGTGENVKVLLARGATPAAAQEAVRAVEVEVGGGPVHTSRVRELVRSLVSAEEQTRITVLTDSAGTAEMQEVLEPWLQDENVEVEVASVGENLDTHGLASVRAVPLNANAGEWLVEGEVLAYPPSSEALTIRVTFESDDVAGALPWEELTVRPRGERTPFAFETSLPGSGVLTLRLPEDALPLDNVARVLLRGEQVPLRILIAGEVARPLVDALSRLNGSEVVLLEEARRETGSNEFDLAVVGPGVLMPNRPASTVLWLAGVRADGRQGAEMPVPTELWSGTGTVEWAGVADVPGGAIGLAHSLPSSGDATVLLHSDRGPLLQVRSTPQRTDVQAAWSVGDSRWARELGFARFVSDLAAGAQPRHGAWTDARCLLGRSCSEVEGQTRADPIGVHEVDGERWVVDVRAGPETNLGSPGVKFGSEPDASFPWKRMDSGLALLAALIIGVDTARAMRRRRGGRRVHGASSNWVSVTLRFVAVGALLLVTAGVPVPSPRFTERTTVIVDPWALTDAAADEGGQEALASILERADSVVLAQGTGQLIRSRDALVNSESHQAAGYDLTAALELAAASLGSGGGRLIVAGLRGDEPERDSGMLAGLSARAVTVDVAPPPSAPAAEAWIDSIGVPAVVRAGETVTLRVGVSGAGASERGVEVTVDGESLEAIAGSGRAFAWEAAAAGLYLLQARLAAAGPAGAATNDALAQFVKVEPAGRVALVTAGEDAPLTLVDLLQEYQFEVDTLRPTDLPTSIEDYLSYDLVALLDVPAVDLHPLRQATLERWVREYGGGLVIAGARNSFGPGGYLRTPLEDLSPLSARVPGEQPQAAIAFVLDRSGSMQQTVEGITRMAFTKQATVEAVELLHPDSEVSIVLFDDVAHLLKPLGPPDDVAARLEPITAGGGTNLYPALEAAFAQLEGTNAEAKHMIVMTDGLAQHAPFDDLIPFITNSDITISTVAVGRGADVNLLEDIARSGGGSFHRSDDVRALPSILSQEAMLLSGNPVREGPVQPVFAPGEAAFIETLPESFPQLSGYVRTTPKEEAEVHARTPDGDPLLASWRHGIGRVVALATPLAGEWSEAWTGTEFGEELVRQSFRWVAAPVLQPGLNLDVRREGDALVASVRVLDDEGAPIEGERIVVRAQAPNGETQGPVLLDDLGRGVYRGVLDAFVPGRYDVVAELQLSDAGGYAPAERTVFLPYPSSLGFKTGRVAVASGAANATGGRIVLNMDDTQMRPAFVLAWSARMGPWVWLAILCISLALILDARRVHRSERVGSLAGSSSMRKTGRTTTPTT
ncbi:MAG: VWA domain-containing protein [Trueperaceae bacterium]